MATKKLTVLAPKKKIRPFDLVSGKDSVRIMNAMLNLQQTDGWALYVQMFEANMQVLEKQILDKADLDRKPLSDEEVDALRERRAIYMEMLEWPNDVVQRTMKLDDPEENDDPYHKTNPHPRDKDV